MHRTSLRDGRILAALALACSLHALVGTDAESLSWGGALLLAGLPVFAFMRYRAVAA